MSDIRTGRVIRCSTPEQLHIPIVLLHPIWQWWKSRIACFLTVLVYSALYKNFEARITFACYHDHKSFQMTANTSFNHPDNPAAVQLFFQKFHWRQFSTFLWSDFSWLSLNVTHPSSLTFPSASHLSASQSKLIMWDRCARRHGRPAFISFRRPTALDLLAFC